MSLQLNPIAFPLAALEGLSRALIFLALLSLAAADRAGAGSVPKPAERGSLGTCLNAVTHGRTGEISCDYEALLTDDERADMRRLSRGLLQDASCLVNVRIARPPVDAALTQSDYIFEAPPQPVLCNITTRNGAFPITSTFAPRVVFKGGVAVEATPGLGEVTGINRYLAWPIIQYVNRSAGIRANMLAIINGLRPRLAKASGK